MTLLHHFPLTPWREMDRLFRPLPEARHWAPPFDISETDSAFVLRSDLPGMDQKDIEVRIDDGRLIVSGGREAGGSDERYSRRERPRGKFSRRFWLPETVDAEGVKASYNNGVLELSLPKRELPDRSRLVTVN